QTGRVCTGQNARTKLENNAFSLASFSLPNSHSHRRGFLSRAANSRSNVKHSKFLGTYFPIFPRRTPLSLLLEARSAKRLWPGDADGRSRTGKGFLRPNRRHDRWVCRFATSALCLQHDHFPSGNSLF